MRSIIAVDAPSCLQNLPFTIQIEQVRADAHAEEVSAFNMIPENECRPLIAEAPTCVAASICGLHARAIMAFVVEGLCTRRT